MDVVCQEGVKSAQMIAPRPLLWTRFARRSPALAALAIVTLLILGAISAPLLAGKAPEAIDLMMPNTGPSREHPLGTDSLGRDVWARLVYGSRVSLVVGFTAAGLSTLIGITIGALSGYYGGWIDAVAMRTVDIVMSFPMLLLVILVVAVVGPSIYNIVLVLGLLGWPGIARLVRGSFLSLRDREFVLAARSLGASDRRLIVVHILPNVIFPVIVAFTLEIAGAILIEAGLSFLGLGVQQPTPSWGSMLNEAQRLSVLQRYPWQWIPPGIAIATTVLVINILGDGLRDTLDPHRN